MEFEGNWPIQVMQNLLNDMVVIDNFISPSDEKSLMEEIEPYLKRMRYERDHWDDAIQGFRETERKAWYPQNKEVINRIIARAFPNAADTLPHIHVLDLEATGASWRLSSFECLTFINISYFLGFIKPHVDSVRYCGTTISGISLLSDSVMRLIRTTEDHSGSDDYRNQPAKPDENKKDLCSVKILLKRYSLYIMSQSARYNFTHEILKNEESYINNQKVEKSRRISIICRNEPKINLD